MPSSLLYHTSKPGAKVVLLTSIVLPYPVHFSCPKHSTRTWNCHAFDLQSKLPEPVPEESLVVDVGLGSEVHLDQLKDQRWLFLLLHVRSSHLQKKVDLGLVDAVSYESELGLAADAEGKAMSLQE